MVPRAGVEPARPYGQRILSPLKWVSPSLTKRYEPVFTGLAVVKVSLGLVSYQHARHHLSPIFEVDSRRNLYTLRPIFLTIRQTGRARSNRKCWVL